MRKKERETTRERALAIFDQSPYVTLSMIDEESKPYAVMLSPVREGNEVYFHCAMAGKKLDCLMKNPNVCLSAVSNMEVVPQHTTVDYASCIIDGIASIVENGEEKQKWLYKICERYSPSHMEGIEKVIEKAIPKVCIVKIVIKRISGKVNDVIKK